MARRPFEEISVGESHELGTWTITEDEIVSFAERYDPQLFHVEKESAQESIYGGLIASGWHTASLTMRVMVDEFLSDVRCLGARGVDNLRWHDPVRPGDTIATRVEVLDKEVRDTNSEFGDVIAHTTGVDEDGQEVISWTNILLVQQDK